MLFDLRCGFKRGGESDIGRPSTWGDFVMRLLPVCIAALAATMPAAVLAQAAEQAPSDRRIVFDTTVDIENGAATAGEESAFDRAVRERRQQRQVATQPTACTTQDDIITAGAAHRPRYDANGALIRAPAASCAPPPAAVPHAASTDDDRLIVERESSGGCTEDRLLGTRTCRSSGSITIGNSAEGNERSRQMVDEMLDDLRRD